MGDLKAFPPELVAETALSWTVASDGDCGGSPANGYDSALVPLVTTLPRQGFTSGVGQPFALTVTFDSCPVTLKEWETQAETAPFTEDVQVEQLVVKTREVGCYTSSSQGPSTSSLSFGYDYDGNYIQTTTTTPGDVTTSTFGCTTEQYTDGETEIVTVTQERVENYGVSHRRHHASATGTIRIAFDGGVRDAPFAIEADSDDDLSYNPRHGSDRHGFHMLSEPQARDRLHDKLVAKIYEVRDQVLEARAQVFVAQAQESAAAGNAFGTDHAYFIASQITSRPAPQFSQWMQGRYRITNDVLVAAVGELPLPRLDVVAGHEVELPRVPINLRAHYYESPAMLAWERRRILMLTVTAGPTLSRQAAGDTSGMRAALATTLIGAAGNGPAAGFGVRYTDGIDLTGARHVEGDMFLGGGFLLGGLTLTPLVGFGADGTVNHQQRDGATLVPFHVPGGAYVEYGARMGYAFKYPPVTLDVAYAKAFRSASAMPTEKRADVRVIVLTKVLPFAVTARYTEYLSETDGFIMPFGPEGRAAQTWWVLGGVGF